MNWISKFNLFTAEVYTQEQMNFYLVGASNQPWHLYAFYYSLLNPYPETIDIYQNDFRIIIYIAW